MLILISQLIGRQVIGFDDAIPIGVVRDPIINPDNGKVAGYFIGHGAFNLKQGVLPADDIVAYDESRVIVDTHSEVIQETEEEPRIREILEKKIAVLGANVFTESGKNLGKATDLLLDTELNMVVKYYVHSLITDRIIAGEHVIRIEKRGIIVDDEAPTGATVTAEAVN